MSIEDERKEMIEMRKAIQACLDDPLTAGLDSATKSAQICLVIAPFLQAVPGVGVLVSIEDEATSEAVEALDRLTQIALDNTSEDAHESVYEDARLVRAEWQASRKVEAAPSDTDWERLIEVMREARNPDGAVVLRYENAADAILAAGFSRAQPVQVEHECEWECVSEMEHLQRAYDGLKVEYAAYRKGARTRLSQAVQVQVNDSRIAKALSIIDRDVEALANLDPTELRAALGGEHRG